MKHRYRIVQINKNLPTDTEIRYEVQTRCWFWWYTFHYAESRQNAERVFDQVVDNARSSTLRMIVKEW